MRGEWPEEAGARLREQRDLELDGEQLAELFWGTNAPRSRMARLLWQSLQDRASAAEFHRRFTLNMTYLAEDASRCAAVLPPIQERLRGVLAGYQQRIAQDEVIGQGRWGETWWLPPAQARLVRQQLRRARPDLLEQASDYQEALETHRRILLRSVVGAFDIPVDDPDRVYLGRHEQVKASVLLPGRAKPIKRPMEIDLCLVAGSASEAPLVNAYTFEGPGQMAWGYHGHGSNALAASILADAVGGDALLPEHRLPGVPDEEEPRGFRPASEPRQPRNLREAFLDEVVGELPDDGFHLPRPEVLAWLERHGVDRSVLEAAGREREARRARHA